ncbi:MAG: hypothetical protein IPN17_19475 [Deltaproteobacteria bacterium]|nr:hypothetical protein [Deltaproteobacteria bacterium]MBK7066250.1 hypothetical protein [Deltaproteobacteria bacterium]MBK8694398.1 hypothetical protein [Deltaproteobacteria bacterium]MBP6834396.1 hypothetical protein [Deltaproteobacteria bacterium]
MGYQRGFDEEIGRAASLACINDGMMGQMESFALDVDTSTQNVTISRPGIYRVFLKGSDPSKTVAIMVPFVGGSSPTVTLPTSGSGGEPCRVFAGDQTVLVRITAGFPTVFATLDAGSGTLYFVGIVPT